MVTHKTARVDGLSVFYREAGDAGRSEAAPARRVSRLVPPVPEPDPRAGRAVPRPVSPDYPGFGNTDMPDPTDVGLHLRPPSRGRRGPARDDRVHRPDGHLHAGLRRADRQPDHQPPSGLAASGRSSRTRTAYEEGLHRGLGRHPPRAVGGPDSPETEAPLMPFLQPETVKAIYTTGHRDPDEDQPRQLEHGRPFFLARPNAHRRPARPLLRLPHERALYPAWQAILRERQPQYADPLGPGTTSSSPRRVARPTCATCRRRADPARHGALRGRGQPRGDRRGDRRVLRHEGASGRPGVGGRPVGRGVGLLLAPRRARALRGRSECRSSARTTTEQGAEQAISSKPSDGLEPSTPSLPCAVGGQVGHRRERFPCKSVSRLCVADARACPRVLNLLYPSRTRVVLSILKTDNACFDDQ